MPRPKSMNVTKRIRECLEECAESQHDSSSSVDDDSTTYEKRLVTLKRNCECGKGRIPCAEFLSASAFREVLIRRQAFFKNADEMHRNNRMFGELHGFYRNENGVGKGSWDYR